MSQLQTLSAFGQSIQQAGFHMLFSLLLRVKIADAIIIGQSIQQAGLHPQ